MGLTGVRSPLDRLLEAGLIAVVVIAPLPFASVGAPARLALELTSFALLALWAARAFALPTVLPPRPLLGALLALLVLAVVQLVPLPGPLVDALAPGSAELRRTMRAPDDIRLTEQEMVGAAARERPPTLSVDPVATASALRTGAALVALLVVATTVAASRGAGRIALALLLSAAAQGLYGFLVLVSGNDRIWAVKKQFYLDSATGTFVNRNHFAGYLAMGLAVGLALAIRAARRRDDASGRRPSLAAWLGGAGSRTLLLVLALGLAGLGVAFSTSRAGIAVSLAGLVAVAVAGGRRRRLGPRLAAVALVLAVVAVPLAQVGWDQVSDRFGRVQDDLTRPGSRSTVWLDSLSMAAAFPVAGAGFGTFASAYPVYRSPEVRAFYAHAHSDPLQAAVEGGLAAVVALALAIASLGALIVRGLAGAKGTLAAGLAAALATVLLHSLVDFPFHIPANAATAAVVAGLLCGLPWVERG